MTSKTHANPAHKVELNRVFDAPPARVFAAWSKPELWSRWFPPREFTMTVNHMDFRVGGGFDASFEGMGMVAPFTGTYTEIVPGERLVWTSEFPIGPKELMCTTVTFTDRGGKTEVNVVQTFSEIVPELQGAMDGAPIGWGQSLDKLGEFLAETA